MDHEQTTTLDPDTQRELTTAARKRDALALLAEIAARLVLALEAPIYGIDLRVEDMVRRSLRALFAETHHHARFLYSLTMYEHSMFHRLGAKAATLAELVEVFAPSEVVDALRFAELKFGELTYLTVDELTSEREHAHATLGALYRSKLEDAAEHVHEAVKS